MKKSLFKSKTFWFNLASALVPMYPPAGRWLVENAAVVGSLWAVLATVLRMVTKDRVVLID